MPLKSHSRCLSIAVAALLFPFMVQSPLRAAEYDSTPPNFDGMAITIIQKLDPKNCSVSVVVDYVQFIQIISVMAHSARGPLPGFESESMKRQPYNHAAVWAMVPEERTLHFIYASNIQIDKCHFETKVSVPDVYGNLEDHLMTSFDFDRGIYSKIKWDRFDSSNIALISHNFTISEWFGAQMDKERN